MTEDDLAFDLGVLGDLLRADGVDVTGELSANRVGRGQSNLTYTIDDAAGRRWIARRPPRGNVLESAHDVQREFGILSALQATDVPVPRMLGKYVDERLAESPVVVMEHVDGLVVDRHQTAEALSYDLRGALGPALVTTLASIHEVDVISVGLDGLSSHAPYAARQINRWARQWDESRTRELPALDELTCLLRHRMPEQRQLSLVHGDFHIQNVITDPQTGDVRAVLDWELSTLGDPLADVGSLLAYWPEATDEPTALFAASTLPGFVGRADLAEAYVKASGRDVTDLPYWHVLGLWKIAIIAEGVRRRALDDPRNAADGGPPQAHLADQLIDRAWRTAVDAGLDR
ncbi:acyl-CoA dehydrogenase [Rhodococcus opacus PD630]|uniref:phosphotransferase family protein n=1 Tax=Rhodococcus TaxID=1827 RepID=UPI00029CCF4C|nr:MULTISPECIES: phosphotransferase family protein [Rhodococcus]AHK35792.1 Acyl-CoA dehydrogenase family member 10 [Rhodococcus opacus PD630]EHI43384.1 acyl-CoA dehydrogenase [Rhodococcus opacus PD630]KXX59638.1 aminoglycoside phosphotransferase [Rhodococcus sp. LB1]